MGEPASALGVRRKSRTRDRRRHGFPYDLARRGSRGRLHDTARCNMRPPPTIESPAATSAAIPATDAPTGRRGRRVRPTHVVGGAIALTAAIMALGAPAPWPESHAAPATVGVGSGGPVFGPAAVTVAQGDTVTWQWQGGQHSVTSTSSEPFDSGAMTAGTFQHTFNTAGTFTYVCVWHSNMQGTVTVTPAPAAPATGTAAPSSVATAGTAGSAATPAAAAANPATAGGVPRLARVPPSGPRPLFSLNHPAAPAPTPPAAGGARSLPRVRRSAPRLLFSLSPPATVATVAVSRTRTTPVGRLDAKPGKGSIVLALNRLRVGRYTLLVGAKNALGTTTRTRVRVNVTRALRHRALAMQRAARTAKAPAPAAASVPVVAQAAAALPPPVAAPAAPVATPPADAGSPVQCGGSNHSGHGHGSGGPPCEGDSGGSSGGNDSHGG